MAQHGESETVDIKSVLARVVDREGLSSAEMAAIVGQFMDGAATPAQIGAFLTAMRMKGESVDEVVGAAQAMRQRMLRVDFAAPVILDTCGTGGDGSGSVNISTLAALVIAACGVPVAKHGNRALSSRSGSHDVIEALGIDPAPNAETAARCLREVGLAFLFAPVYHAATKNVAIPRRELGFRTLFNLLGPLTNPGGARFHLNGVYAADRLEMVARAHAALGATRAMVVHGAGGLDEIAVHGPTEVAELRDGVVTRMTIAPTTFGLPEADAAGLKGGEPAENAQLLQAALEGAPGAIRIAALLSAAAGLYVAGKVSSLEEGARLAATAIDTGAARNILERLQTLTPRAT
jgi:anthranilate phosphoribosyltransferase